MSFDPQNPRGTSTPPPEPARQSSYIPPQPVNRGPSRNLVAAGIAIALVVIVLGAIAINLFANGPSGGAPGKRGFDVGERPLIESMLEKLPAADARLTF